MKVQRRLPSEPNDLRVGEAFLTRRVRAKKELPADQLHVETSAPGSPQWLGAFARRCPNERRTVPFLGLAREIRLVLAAKHAIGLDHRVPLRVRRLPLQAHGRDVSV